MEEPDDFRLVDTRLLSSQFRPPALQPIHELNRRLIAILIEESAKADAVSADLKRLGVELGMLSSDARERLAVVPISLVDAGFKLKDRWSALAAGDKREGTRTYDPALPISLTLEIAPLVFGLAATTAHASPESAQIVFGMSPVAANAFANFSVPLVQWLGQARSHWLCLRWLQHLEVWRRLMLTASRPDVARLPPVDVRAVNQMLADLELATSVSSETRRMHP